MNSELALATMTTILEKQINLQRIEGTDNYTASWHEDWTVGPGILVQSTPLYTFVVYTS